MRFILIFLKKNTSLASQMPRTFILNLFLLVVINLLIKPIWIFGIDRGVQLQVGVNDYGLYFALLNFSFLFNILLDAGITNFNNRNLSQHIHLIGKYFSGIVFIKLFLSAIYIFFLLIAAWIVGYSTWQGYLLMLLGINQILLSFILYLRTNFTALQQFKTDSFLSVFDKLWMIIICGPILWSNWFEFKITIEFFIYAQGFSYILTILLCLFLLGKRIQLPRLKFNKALFYYILKSAAPYALLFVLMTIYMRIDSIFLERLLPNGKAEAGVYAAAYRLVDASNMFSVLFAGLLLPMFSNMLKKKEDIKPLLFVSYTLLIIPTLLLILGGYYYRLAIMEMLYSKLGAFAIAEVFGILFISTFALSTTYIFGTLLTAAGRLKLLISIASISILISVMLNLILIPVYGAIGAAISNVSALLFSGLAHQYYAYVSFNIHLNYKKLGAALIYIIVVASTLYTSSLISVHWIISLSIWFILSILLAAFFQLIPFLQISKLIKTEIANRT